MNHFYLCPRLCIPFYMGWRLLFKPVISFRPSAEVLVNFFPPFASQVRLNEYCNARNYFIRKGAVINLDLGTSYIVLSYDTDINVVVLVVPTPPCYIYMRISLSPSYITSWVGIKFAVERHIYSLSLPASPIYRSITSLSLRLKTPLLPLPNLFCFWH